MGQRGPLRDPNSVRGRKEAARALQLEAHQASLKAKRRSKTPEPESVSEPAVEPAKPPTDLPQRQPWLSPAAAVIWQNLVDLLIAADVPVKAIDTYALSMAANCLASVEAWANSMEIATAEVDLKERLGMGKLTQKFQADAQVWLDKLGATPSSRLRMGIKPVVKKEQGAIAQLLARRLNKRVGAA